MVFPGSLRAFSRKKGIDIKALYRKSKPNGWLGARVRIRELAMAKVQDNAVDKLAAVWEVYIAFWDEVKTQAQSILTKNKGKRSSMELERLTRAIDTALKGERLVRGEVTERTENKNVNVFVDLVQAIKERDAKYGVSD